MRTASPVVGLAPVLLVVACGGSGPSVVPAEPIQVTGGQFVSGPLPGTPPPADGGPASTGPLAITQISSPVLPVGAGAIGESFSGLATNDAVAVGVALANKGTGYWVVPVGAPDPLFPGQISFGFFANFNPNDPPGIQMVRIVALGHGGAGQASEAPICIKSSTPDNGHSCNPAKDPPAAMISLQWDTGFDLDLHVVRPDGTDLNPKSPLGVLTDGGAGSLVYDRDSWGACVPDGFYREDLVFQTPPAHGSYAIRVDPFASCGQAAAHFTVTAYTRAGTCPDCGLQPVFTQGGELLGSQATGGASPGLFVHDQKF